jgi:phosphate:Na+ symporter
MKVMSDGIQQIAGDRMQRVLGFMTGNRFTAVLTGFVVTALIQSSSATTVMVVSFVNAGLLTLTQSIGVIMGANIGTTVTAWIVSIVGFTFKISALALPAVGIGFVMMMIKWKRRDLGTVILGFGLLFVGLDFLTNSMPKLRPDAIEAISSLANRGYASTLLATGIGLVMTLIIHSSSASTAIMLTMAHQEMISYPFAAAMILGANIGTTLDAALASIGAKTAAKQAALVHILFNVIGTVWALIFLTPLLALVDLATPGAASGPGITTHLAMLHTIFNALNTLLFFPFVKPFAALVSFLIKEEEWVKEDKALRRRPYRFAYVSGAIQDAPELNIIRAEKEIRDMAGVASSMYAQVGSLLEALKNHDPGAREKAVETLLAQMQEKEIVADEMREELTRFLMECAGQPLNYRSEQNVSQLLRIVADLEDMTDSCYGTGLLLERSIKKNHLFKVKELEALSPYVNLVEDFLVFVQGQVGRNFSAEQSAYVKDLEKRIGKHRDKLRKRSRKRIEAGENVKTELLFIDLVRRIEKLGDYCYNISGAIAHIR